MKRLVLLFLGFFLLVISCKHYKPLTVSTSDLLENDAFVKHLNQMDYYVHTSNKVIKLANVSIDSSGIQGDIDTIIRDPVLITELQSPERKEIKDHLYDINIYPINDPTANYVSVDSLSKLSPETGILKISQNNIKQLQGHTLDKKKTFSQTLFIILLAVIAVGVIIGTTVLIAQASSNTSAGSSNSGNSGSGNSSGTSSTGSGTSSGTSGNGSQTSSGASSGASNSNSNSGCYVATMVYGSYDAPSVMVLRKFRDNFLSKSIPGRAFIRWYYRNSPGFVERNRDKRYVHQSIKPVLDLFVWLIK